ncbi:MAG: 30S ribosomal protein S6--L-glutamate ligase [Cytophagaceae bacterium]|nr:30S ribosomal protein S6--L-glutamate ligase [Cytophagaceae bacterium]
MRIAILSRNKNLYSTQRLVEACIERGHEPLVIDPLKCVVGIEAGNPTINFNGEMLQHIDAVIPRIGASVTFYGTAVLRQFEMMKVFAANRSLAIIRSRDKLRSLQYLAKSGLGVPKTVFASRPDNVEELIQHVGGTPVIIKLIEGTQGIGVVLAETKKAAKSVIEAFYGMNADILVQEFINEAGNADIRAFVVNCEVVGAMKRQGKDGEFRSNLHRGGKGEAVELTPLEKETAIKAARIMGLGVAGVDMIRSSRGPLTLEVNSSPGLKGIETYSTKDIAGKIIEFVEMSTVKFKVKH